MRRITSIFSTNRHARNTTQHRYWSKLVVVVDAQLKALSLREVLQWCAWSLPGLVQVSSFGSSGMVIMHEMAALRRRVPTVFLDTLYHFDETLTHVRRSVERYGLDLRTYCCAGVATRAEFEELYGEKAMWKT